MSAMSLALRHGVAAAQARQFERARKLLQQATTESPDDAVAWFWLAVASPTAEAAIPCLRRVLEIEPAHVQGRAALVKMLVTEAKAVATAGNHTKARALATEVSQLSPDAGPVWLALAALTDDPVERINMLRQAAVATPDDAVIRARLRQALLARGVMAGIDRTEARACFREASVIDPSDVRVWQALANLADSRAEWLQALRDLLRAAPGHAQGRSTLRAALVADATALGAAGSAEAACELWREAIALTGGDVEVCLGLAAITLDPEEAERAIEQANDLDPQDERVLAAMERLRTPQIDPAALEAPDDAFERFGLPADGADPAEAADAPVAQLDTLLDELADLDRLAPPAPAPGPVAASAAPAAPAARAARSNGASGGVVMIVDDSPTIRKILGLSLERAGYKVIAEADGESAIERLRDVVPDLILLDIAMPKLDGYEVCKRIKQDPRTADVPVVMLSGKDAFFDKVKGHMAGASEYLTKPFETPVVLSVVATFCQPSAEVAHG